MSKTSAYQSGIDYFKTYSGVLKIIASFLVAILVIFATILEVTFQAQFFCGICIYGLASTVVLTAFHVSGTIKNASFPWFWVECFNCFLLAVLLLIGASMVLSVLTKAYIVMGIIGYVAVLVYVLDAIETFGFAKEPRARYVWTTPNMPE